jgi:hypothetical protein
MKKLIALFSLTLSFSTLADTVDTKTFVYDGTQNSVELILNSEKTHTEYRVEDIRTTCYRQEIAGYRTVCSGGGPRPYPGPGRPGPGYPGPGRGNCYSTPIYRQVAYSCTQTVRTPYQVKDYDVDARVIVDVTKVSPEATPGEVFRVTLNGDSLSFDVSGSKKFFVVKKLQDVRSNMRGSVKMIDAVLAAELIEAAPVLKALEVSNISMRDSVLSFKTGPVAAPSNIGYHLTVKKAPVLGSDTTIFDRELIRSEVNASATGEVSVDVLGLGVKIASGRHSITVKAFAKFDGNLMNSNQFSELSASRTLIYKP